MEQQHSFRSQLVEWLKEIIPYGHIDKYVRKTREGFVASPNRTDRHANHVAYIFCTAEHRYSISASPTYLGCIASATRCRPGEDWTRGNDLPDGKFCRETWEHIKDAILRYELVKLDPICVPAGVDLPPCTHASTPEEDEYSAAHVALMQANLRFEKAQRAYVGANKNDPNMPATRLEAEPEL